MLYAGALAMALTLMALSVGLDLYMTFLGFKYRGDTKVRAHARGARAAPADSPRAARASSAPSRWSPSCCSWAWRAWPSSLWAR